MRTQTLALKRVKSAKRLNASKRVKAVKRVRPRADEAERWVGSYRFVVRGILWLIYLAVVVAFVLWWVKT